MHKIFLIIKREYLTRVRKKSFLVMTFLGPLLFAGMLVVPTWMAMNADEKHRVEVIDETGLFDSIPESKTVKFDHPPVTLEQAQMGFYDTPYSAILYIPVNVMNGNTVKIFYKKQLGSSVENYIKSSLEKMVYSYKLVANKIDIKAIRSAETTLNLVTEKQSESGQTKRTNTGIYTVLGYAGGLLIYMFIFMYGIQVMRGVMEEKTNRIVEIILSSVKPFQLMMGKIIGIALVGLTQFLLWLILTICVYSVIETTILKGTKEKVAEQAYLKEQVFKKGSNLQALEMSKKNAPGEVFELYESVKSVNFVEILICFFFYFLGGYLLYSALYAAVGSAVDSETDTQQFMLPISLPIILSFVFIQNVLQNPEGSLAYWLSMIPFTSPIIMMVRLPFGVPLQEVVLSISLLIAGFIATTWLAAKIYRTGILMYGKKVTYKELWKWLSYKE